MPPKKATATVAAKLIVGAAQAADLPTLKALVAAGGDINASYRHYRALHALIQTKPHAEATAPSAAQVACFKWMLKHGADPEQLGAWPASRAVLVAAFMGARVYVDALLEAGARVDVFVSAALGDATAVRRTLKNDATLARARDVGELTILQCAAASRMWRHEPKLKPKLIEIATMALDAGADPHAATRSWDADVDAVYFAASSHHVAMFELLLTRGADATRALTPALWNGGKDFAPLADAALAHGADVNRAHAEGRPLLNDLIRWGQFAPAMWLVEHGADPNRAQPDGLRDSDNQLLDSAGWTALHQAASRGNVRMVEALMAAGADPSRTDRAGRTAYDIARTAPLKSLFRKARGIIHS